MAGIHSVAAYTLSANGVDNIRQAPFANARCAIRASGLVHFVEPEMLETREVARSRQWNVGHVLNVAGMPAR